MKGFAREQGLGLVSAIFVVTVLAVLAAGMAALVARSAERHTQQILNQRALDAARSGLQVQQAQQAMGQCVSKQTFELTAKGLRDCRLQLSCRGAPIQGGQLYLYESRASCGSGEHTALRQLEKRVQR